MSARVLALVTGCVFASVSVRAALPPAWVVRTNPLIDMVNPAVNTEFPYIPSPVMTDSLAADPTGMLYVANPAGRIFTVPGPAIPLANTGFTQIGDLSYSSGGLWGFSNSSDTLFFFDLTTTAVTYSLPITSGLTGFEVTGVTQQQSTGDIYLSGFVNYNADVLFLLDLNTASANPVGVMSHSDNLSYIADIEFDDSGALLAMTWVHRHFLTVNPADASTTLLSTNPFHRDVTGLAVDTSDFPEQAGVPEVGTWLGGVALGLLGLGRRLRRR